MTDVNAALRMVSSAAALVGQCRGLFSKAQKRQIAQAGQTLIQIASGTEIATYDTPSRQHIRAVAKKAAPRKRAAVKVCGLKRSVTGATRKQESEPKK